MEFITFWRQLGAFRKIGFAAGVVAVAALTGSGAYWLLSKDYEVVLQSSNQDKVAAAVREIERLKIPYHVSEDGSSVEVPRTELGHVKVNLGTGGSNGASAVGFELFNNSDFSTTEFTQKVNFQRALQGELAKTISGISGISSARVHLVLAETSFLRRKSVAPTAAVHVAMEPKAQLSSAQVFGIQKLIVAAVPEIKIDDISVVDQDGITLSHSKASAADNTSRGQIEMKREVDSYLESKVKKVLDGLDPEGQFSVSVDATLDWSDKKVTTEDVLPVEGGGSTGGLIRERQSQRTEGSILTDSTAPSRTQPVMGNMTRETEYKFGHRKEQVAFAPGDLERVSVAVLARTRKTDLDSNNVKNLVAHAIGVRKDRGDSIAVVLLPAFDDATLHLPSKIAPQPTHQATPTSHAAADNGSSKVVFILALVFGGGLFVAAWLWLKHSQKRKNITASLTDDEIDQLAKRISQWLEQEPIHARN